MPKIGRIGFHCLTGCAALALLVGHAGAAAAQPAEHSYALEAQPLSAALTEVARISGAEVVAAADLLAGRTTPRLAGRMTAAEAIDRLLAGTGLRAERVGAAFIIRPLGEANPPPETDGLITVTGTRIRGAPVASPVITVGREEMRDAGHASLGEAVHAIPQNFGGGQNPGIGDNVPGTSGVNVGGGSSINLRGLGSDATLTLLNGHRLSYSASRQSVDISAIPFAAVDRIEIVADGASALYGSDAVAGVANIILKREHEGLDTSARFGASTDGGNVQQQYGAITGTGWRSGGLFAAYEFGRSTEIDGRQRSYAAEGLTLYPALKHHNALLAGHQALGSDLSFKFDAIYNRRSSASRFPLNASGSRRGEQETSAESFAIAPSLELSLGRDWRLALAGMAGGERIRLRTDQFNDDVLTRSTPNRYRNEARSVELSADGGLFALPGGTARIALGAGYRSNRFVNFRGASSLSNIDRSQDSHFAYGELSLPFVSPDQRIAFVDRLSASAALRYERYPGVDSVVTPKLGLIYAPIPDFELKASWGQSFRAPTFFQQYQLQSAYLVPATIFGGAPQQNVLFVEGGNVALKPERATSWTVTAVLKPRALPQVRIEISYFDVAYRDRIVTPIPFLARALVDPIYSDLITLNPAPTEQARIIAEAGQFVNAVGAYDPAAVVAIVNNSNLNAGRQSIRGVDLLAHYGVDLAEAGELSFDVNASYLKSSQRLTPDQPDLALAGRIFNPPSWRARATVGWDVDALTLTGAVTHVGRVDDVRFEPVAEIPSMTTVDLTARYRVDAGPSLFRGTELSLSIHNIFNDKPGTIRTGLFTDTPYDSTNYSPVGRFVRLAVTKQW